MMSMNPIVAKDITETLGKVINALSASDYSAMSELSNHVIHDASIFQDDDSVSFAILVYALSKTLQRCVESGIAFTKFQQALDDAYAAIKTENFDSYREKIHSLFALIQSTDTKLKLYIEEVVHKAKIKKGGKLHEHGISLARTAELLGIGQWELMNYIGKTKFVETLREEDVKKRIAVARRLFAR